MERTILSAMLGLMLVCPVFAQDSGNNFETTAEGIIDRLLPPDETVGEPAEEPSPATRGTGSGGWNNAFDTDAAGKTRSFSTTPPSAPDAGSREVVGTRAIKVYHKEGNKEVWTTVVSPEKRTGQYLNLAVEFDTASYSLRPNSIRLLNELGRALSDPRLADLAVFVNGHTDSDGSDASNLRLSYSRAESVRQYLVSNFDISPRRLLVRGYGEGMPLAPNTTAANKQANRRVEIVADR